MNKNIWNIKNPKERLAIRERTEAQKRHLISLIKARSHIDDHNKLWKTKSLNSSFVKKQQKSIMKGNQNLFHRIMNVQKLSSSRASSMSGKKFLSLTQNLKNVSLISRETYRRKIQQQNNKFFTRLVNTTATVSRVVWNKDMKNTRDYKRNLNRTKYQNPDYSQEVHRIIRNKKSSFNHLKYQQSKKKDLPQLHGLYKKIAI